jgi:isopenicillin-N epimerase
LSLPADSAESLLEQFWQGVTPRTKLIFLSHITSPTALRLPIEAICARARAAGILTLIDGAHTVGQIDLDLTSLGVDFYTGNLHKWALAPKGAAFLYTHPQRQTLIEPLVVGWGWGPYATLDFGSPYLNYLQWLGTEDPAAYLAVPAALDFLATHHWPQVRAACHALTTTWLRSMADLTGIATVYGQDDLYVQMGAAPLPPIADLPAFKAELYRRFRVEMPCTTWQNIQLARISVQGYNDAADVEAALHALATLLAEHTH